MDASLINGSIFVLNVLRLDVILQILYAVIIMSPNQRIEKNEMNIQDYGK